MPDAPNLSYCLYLTDPTKADLLTSTPDPFVGPFGDFAEACTRASIEYTIREVPIYVVAVRGVSVPSASSRGLKLRAAYRLARVIRRTINTVGTHEGVMP